MNPPNPPELVDQLVNDNFGLARFWAGIFAETFGYNDALSVAMRGLLEAAQKYDAKLGIPFGTYASVRIKWRAGCERRKLTTRGRGGNYTHLSFDKQLFHDSARTLADELACDQPGPIEALNAADVRAEVQQLLTTVPPRTRKILELRYGLNGKPALLFGEIARRFKVSHQAVQQVESAALRKFWRDKRRKKLEPARRVA